jgi:hypothetical protein
MEYRVVETNIKSLQRTLDEYSSTGWAAKEILWIQLNAKGYIIFERART